MLLASAFRKLLLYEAAYGYTVARLFAKGFMIALALSLVVLALELLARIDGHRLVRRQAALAAQRAIGRITEGMAERGDPSRMPAERCGSIASTGNT